MDYRPDLVVSGGAEGVDTLAADIAEELGVPVLEFLPARNYWNGAGGFKDRNTYVARMCTRLWRYSCVRSKTYGSGWTADETERLGKPVTRIAL